MGYDLVDPFYILHYLMYLEKIGFLFFETNQFLKEILKFGCP